MSEMWALVFIPRDAQRNICTVQYSMTAVSVSDSDIISVSYTHLDVYKRQVLNATYLCMRKRKRMEKRSC